MRYINESFFKVYKQQEKCRINFVWTVHCYLGSNCLIYTGFFTFKLGWLISYFMIYLATDTIINEIFFFNTARKILKYINAQQSDCEEIQLNEYFTYE